MTSGRQKRAVHAVRAFLVAFGMSPFLINPLAQTPALEWLARPLEAWFAFQCERAPLRMLAFGAVCARCLGIYAGMALGALGVRFGLQGKRLELALCVAALAMLADVASEALGWRPAWAPLRVVTGVVLGVTATAVVVSALRAWAQKP
jgi:uncharacterized membrane protein